MRRLGFASAVAASLLLLAPLGVFADDSLSSSENPSTAGDAVTFSAVFTVPCADGVATKSFAIDGANDGYTTFAGDGQVFTATLTTSLLSAGIHSITFAWSTSTPPDPPCGGTLVLTQTVNAPAPPPPSPTEQPPSPATAIPSEPPSAAATPTAAPTATPPVASAARVTLTASSNPQVSMRLLAGGLAVLALVVVGLAFAYRRMTRLHRVC